MWIYTLPRLSRLENNHNNHNNQVRTGLRDRLFCCTCRHDGRTQREASRSCSATQGAEAAFDAQARTAVDPHGPGHGDAPLVQGAHRVRGQMTATRAGEEEHGDLHDAPRRQKPPPPQPVLFSLYEEEPGGRRPPCLGEPPVPQARVQRRSAEQMIESFVPRSRRSCAADGGTVGLGYRFSMLLCRRWWNSWWKCWSPPLVTASSRRLCRRWSWHGTQTQLARRGATALGRGGSTGGCGAHSTLSGNPRRESPPAQGGIQILGKAQFGAVVDVSVNMQRKFQQFMPIDKEVPQILFIARVLDIPVIPLRQALTVQTVQKTPDSTAQFLGRLLTRPLFFNDSCMVQPVLKLWKFRSCSTEKVVDFPVVQDIDKVWTSL